VKEVATLNKVGVLQWSIFYCLQLMDMHV
jgi:hypothetical protein